MLKNFIFKIVFVNLKNLKMVLLSKKNDSVLNGKKCNSVVSFYCHVFCYDNFKKWISGKIIELLGGQVDKQNR